MFWGQHEGRPGFATAIYLIANEVFLRAADALAAADPVGAATLRRASTHWLRHASIETTGLYLHAEDDRRHAQTTDAPPNQFRRPIG